MEDAITIRFVFVIAAVVGCTFGIWWRIETTIAKAKTEAMAAVAIAKAEAIGVATLASAGTTLLSSQFSEYRIYVAENYVSKIGLREFREEVMRGLTEIKDNVHQMHQRMDRVIEFEMKHIGGDDK